MAEAASPGLEAADEAMGAAAVWINGWVVETAAACSSNSNNSNNININNNSNNNNCKVTELG